ncbi:hypothetical protein BB561_001238 [Smittium simulii]|uniref:Helicase ATP-binding domain-containing protein n=1 Tax=Smittium simulii TaxID=133385 RepID=A0A2T9YVG6_9FUNG|nr:hypothetical protein BB561_001238 [Smittium simulii]
MDKKTSRELMARISPKYWTKEQVAIWVEDTFTDKKLAKIFLENEIDGTVLTKFLTYSMLRTEMNIVIGKATKIIEALVILMDKWEIPSARLLNEDLDINLAVASKYRSDQDNKSAEDELERIRLKRLRRNVYGNEPESLTKKAKNYAFVEIVTPNFQKVSSSYTKTVSTALIDTDIHADKQTLPFDNTLPVNNQSQSIVSTLSSTIKTSNINDNDLSGFTDNKVAKDLSDFSESDSGSEINNTPITLEHLTKIQNQTNKSGLDNLSIINRFGLKIGHDSSVPFTAVVSSSISKLDLILGINHYGLVRDEKIKSNQYKTIDRLTILNAFKKSIPKIKISKKKMLPADLETALPDPDLKWINLVDSDSTGSLWFRRSLNSATDDSRINFAKKSIYTLLWMKSLMKKIDTIFSNISIAPIKKNKIKRGTYSDNTKYHTPSTLTTPTDTNLNQKLLKEKYFSFWESNIMPRLLDNKDSLIINLRENIDQAQQDFLKHTNIVNNILNDDYTSEIPNIEQLAFFMQFFTADWLLKAFKMIPEIQSKNIKDDKLSLISTKPEYDPLITIDLHEPNSPTKASQNTNLQNSDFKDKESTNYECSSNQIAVIKVDNELVNLKLQNSNIESRDTLKLSKSTNDITVFNDSNSAILNSKIITDRDLDQNTNILNTQITIDKPLDQNYKNLTFKKTTDKPSDQSGNALNIQGSTRKDLGYNYKALSIQKDNDEPLLSNDKSLNLIENSNKSLPLGDNILIIQETLDKPSDQNNKALNVVDSTDITSSHHDKAFNAEESTDNSLLSNDKALSLIETTTKSLPLNDNISTIQEITDKLSDQNSNALNVEESTDGTLGDNDKALSIQEVNRRSLLLNENVLNLQEFTDKDLDQSSKGLNTQINNVKTLDQDIKTLNSQETANKTLDKSSKISNFDESQLSLLKTNSKSDSIILEEQNLESNNLVINDNSAEDMDITMSSDIDSDENITIDEVTSSNNNEIDRLNSLNEIFEKHNDSSLSQIVPPSVNIDDNMDLDATEENIELDDDEPDWELDKVVDLNDDEIALIEQNNVQMLQIKRQRHLEIKQQKSLHQIQNDEFMKIDKALLKNVSSNRRKLSRIRRVFSCPKLYSESSVEFNQKTKQTHDDSAEDMYTSTTDELLKLGVFSSSYIRVYTKMNDYLRLQCYKYPHSQISSNECFSLDKSHLYSTTDDNITFNKTGAVLLWQSFNYWLSNRSSDSIKKYAFKSPGGFFNRLPIGKKAYTPEIERLFWMFWKYHTSYLKCYFDLINANEKIPFSMNLPSINYFSMSKNYTPSKLQNNEKENNAIKFSENKDNLDNNSQDAAFSKKVNSKSNLDIFGFEAAGAFGEYNEFIDSESDEESANRSQNDSDSESTSGRTIAKIIEELENESRGSNVKVRMVKESQPNKSNSYADKKNKSDSYVPEFKETYMERNQRYIKEKNEEYHKKMLESRIKETEAHQRVLDQGLGVRSTNYNPQDNMLAQNKDNPNLNNLEFNSNLQSQAISTVGASLNGTSSVGFNFDNNLKTLQRTKYFTEAEITLNLQQRTQVAKDRANILEGLNSTTNLNNNMTKNLLNEKNNLKENVEYKNIVVNPGHKQHHRDIFIPKFLGKWLKPHQVDSVKFMWKNLINCDGNPNENTQHGCVIAHAMGLGKTLQVVTFIYTLLEAVHIDKAILKKLKSNLPANSKKYKLSGVPKEFHGKQILILCPPTLQTNWQREFQKWLEYDGQDPINARDVPLREHESLEREKHLLRVRSIMGMVLRYDKLDQNSQESKLAILGEWYERGGVVIMGYAGFRDILKKQQTSGKSYQNIKKFSQKIYKYLFNPGPAIVVADEGHSIKNQKSQLSISAEKIRTKARICLTGYPLQNNLDEYWTMVNFVYPKILGDYSGFHSSYSVPIANGMFIDSTPVDRQIGTAKLRALQDHLAPFVLRQDASILSVEIPPKTEYFIVCAMSPLQQNLYLAFLNSFQQNVGTTHKGVIARYSTFTSICNHPSTVKLLFMERKRKLKEQLARANKTIFTGIEGEDDLDASVALGATPQEAFDEITDDSWARQVFGSVAATVSSLPAQSSKLLMLMSIVYQSIILNEKVLIFSHFISTLDFIFWIFLRTGMIELAEKERSRRAVQTNIIARQEGKKSSIFLESSKFSLQQIVLKLDGRTSMDDRAILIDQFNDHKNPSKVFLISTGTGSIGVNLVAATRVILFDVGWNPLYDEQAIARAYRYNQTKPVYVYRLISTGTWEQTMFQNNRHKVGLSLRVVDKLNVDEKIYKEATKKYYAPPPPLGTVKPINKTQIAKLYKQFGHDAAFKSLLTKHSNKIVSAEVINSDTNTKFSALDSEFTTSTYALDEYLTQSDPKINDMVSQERVKLRMFNIPERDRNMIGYGDDDLDIDIDSIELNQNYILMNSQNTATSQTLPQTIHNDPKISKNKNIHDMHNNNDIIDLTNSNYNISNEILDTNSALLLNKIKTQNDSEITKQSYKSKTINHDSSDFFVVDTDLQPMTVGLKKFTEENTNSKDNQSSKTNINSLSSAEKKSISTKPTLLESAKAKVASSSLILEKESNSMTMSDQPIFGKSNMCLSSPKVNIKDAGIEHKINSSSSKVDDYKNNTNIKNIRNLSSGININNNTYKPLTVENAFKLVLGKSNEPKVNSSESKLTRFENHKNPIFSSNIIKELNTIPSVLTPNNDYRITSLSSTKNDNRIPNVLAIKSDFRVYKKPSNVIQNSSKAHIFNSIKKPGYQLNYEKKIDNEAEKYNRRPFMDKKNLQITPSSTQKEYLETQNLKHPIPLHNVNSKVTTSNVFDSGKNNNRSISNKNTVSVSATKNQSGISQNQSNEKHQSINFNLASSFLLAKKGVDKHANTDNNSLKPKVDNNKSDIAFKKSTTPNQNKPNEFINNSNSLSASLKAEFTKMFYVAKKEKKTQLKQLEEKDENCSDKTKSNFEKKDPYSKADGQYGNKKASNTKNDHHYERHIRYADK